MKNKLFFAPLFTASAFICMIGCRSEVEISEWTVSSRDAYFRQAKQVVTEEAAGEAEETAQVKTICIKQDDTAQTMKGFGTCFNELGWTSLMLLTENEREEIFDELFTPLKGACLNRGRLSMGANDFALDWYSPDETPGDFQLKDFSIEQDKQTIIPMIQQAMRYCLDLYLFMSPWCPPRWMKKTGHYAERAVTAQMVEQYERLQTISMTEGIFDNGPLAFHSLPMVNDAVPGEEGKEGVTAFIMESEYLDAYARLFGKFVEAYRAEGINIRMVMPQNEMNSDQNFPSCCWTSADLNTFVGQYLGPQMQKHGVDVYFGTVERPNPLLVDTLLLDKASSKYIKGVAFQWAGKDALPVIHRKYPELDMVMSEQECGNGLNNWEGAMHSWNLQRHYLSNGVTQYYYWNTSLTQGKPSRWGWYQNSLVIVNEQDRTWKFTPEYYELKHLSHYIQPGAKRLLLDGSTYGDMLGFINPDGNIVLVIANQTSQIQPLKIELTGKTIEISVGAETFNTIRLSVQNKCRLF